MPKVSVIIPVYGVEKYIKRCAESLLSQTLDDMEFIFVDDCTPDNSIEILNEVLCSYPDRKAQVRIHRLPNNSGLPTVRRIGVGLASGEYIAHCDSDDWVDSRLYEKMYLYAVRDGLDIVYCDYYRSDGATRQYVKQKEKERFILGPIWNKLVKASLYKNKILYPIENKAEDGALMMQLSFYAKSRGHVGEALYYYFYNPNSICHVPSVEAILKRHQQECANMDLREQFLREKGLYYKYKDYIDSWKFASRKNILPLINQKEYFTMWYNTYPEINKNLLLNVRLPLKSKLLYLAVLLRVYPFALKLINQ